MALSIAEKQDVPMPSFFGNMARTGEIRILATIRF